MKKILNKIGQVLQVVLAAPVKWPAKAGNILKYIALGLGIVKTVMEEEKDADDGRNKSSGTFQDVPGPPSEESKQAVLPKERSGADEVE
ncbi:hypothetical protein QE382_003150 [Sphingobacterium zeae]|uniref:Uncharacterized protein n=1 Tax=Sphingobacterium zeae TaxID=1776859 RepID=A0ABU0U936_9SPHI|nr:hypothetical protein [Sphingobacterium zeae]MDQ1151166.1 hypothetical protein [Sphingobacterium zeae]